MVVVKLPSGREVDISAPVDYERRLIFVHTLYACSFLMMVFCINLSFKLITYVVNFYE